MPEHQDHKVDDAAEFRQAHENLIINEKEEQGNKLMADIIDLAKSLKQKDRSSLDLEILYKGQPYKLDIRFNQQSDLRIMVRKPRAEFTTYDLALTLNKDNNLVHAGSFDLEGKKWARNTQNRLGARDTIDSNFYGVDAMIDLPFMTDIKAMLEVAVQNQMAKPARTASAA